MALTARYPGRCKKCEQSYAAGEQIESVDGTWNHASCVTAPRVGKSGNDADSGDPPPRAGVIPAKFGGLCALCDVRYFAGTLIERPGDAWVHYTCMEKERQGFKKSLEAGSIDLEDILNYVDGIWPGSTSLYTDIWVKKEGSDGFVIHTRPVIYRAGGEPVETDDFRRKAPEAYYPAAQLLAEFANDRFDGSRYPEEVTFPEDE